MPRKEYTAKRQIKGKLFRERVAKQFDHLAETLNYQGPITFSKEVSALQRIGYQVIRLAAEQKEAGL